MSKREKNKEEILRKINNIYDPRYHEITTFFIAYFAGAATVYIALLGQ